MTTPALTMVGPFPPPIHGAAKNTALLCDDLRARGVEVRTLDTAPDGQWTGPRALHHLRRAARALRLAATLAMMPDRDIPVYLVPDGGGGIYYNLLHGLALRLRHRGPVFFHHRNYSHITTTSSAMMRLCTWFGPRLTHIFLEEAMGDAFEAIYGPAAERMVVRNAATCDVVTDAAIPQGPLTVAYLSNLTHEKGFDIAAEAFIALAARDPDVQFALAGTPVDAEAGQTLARLQDHLGARLHYDGAVHGARKQAFFRAADVFVFPTVYRLEAQPNVLYEAMATGAAIVATRHACIPFMLEDAPQALVPMGPDLVRDTEEAILTLLAETPDQATRQARSDRAVATFERLQRGAVIAYEHLLDTLARTGPRP